MTSPHALLRRVGRRLALAGIAFACAGAAQAGTVAPAAAALVAVAMPDDFAGLSETQRVVADFSFGGRPIGQFEIEFKPGRLRILQLDQLIAAIPGLTDTAAVRAALADPALDSNARYLCGPDAAVCEPPHPDVAAVVFDQRRFAVQLVIAPRLLAVRPVSATSFLSAPHDGLSLVDTIGGALAGSDGSKPVYDFHSRTIVAAGDARLLAETSYSSGVGIGVDTAAVQLDRPDRRYSAGIFYVPGLDLIGRRRIAGIGAATQFDTRTDRDLLTGTQLVVFLSQRSRVDLVVEGRLIGSHNYEAGNQTLDTSSLPEGSYPIELHIQEAGGATRIERRFFTKNARIPPPGKTVFFADAGLLAFDRPHTPIAFTRQPFAEIGVARRRGDHLAFDATLIATDSRALAELGANVMTPVVQGRVAVLGSSAGDYGVLAQASSSTLSRFGYNFDIRHISSHDGKPLVAIDSAALNPFTLNAAQQRAQLEAGSFTQASANLSYRLARAQLGLSAVLRHDGGQRGTDYAIGPTVHWAIIQRGTMQLSLDGSVAQTGLGRTVAVGLHFQLFGKRAALGASVGAQSASEGSRRLGSVAQINGSVQRNNVLGGDFTGSGSVQTGIGGTIVQVGADERSALGYLSGSFVHSDYQGISGNQYAMSLQTAFAAGHDVVAVGTRDQNDAVITVGVRGGVSANRYEVLVDGTPQGRIRAGQRLTVSVQPYRRYVVRVRPLGGDLVAIDTKPRTVDAFPGTVANFTFSAEPVLAMFGRLVRPDGTPIANAQIATRDDIAATDDLGYFQFQGPAKAALSVRGNDGRTCRVALDAARSDKGYTALGTLVCRP